MGDFLRKNARTPYLKNFAGAGTTYRVRTNSRSILGALSMTFSSLSTPSSRPAFGMRFWVDLKSESAPPWPRPYIRGWEDLIYASFAPGNFGLIDLHSRRIVARFSPEMASDTRHWNGVILPMLMSIIAARIGAVELHSACVAIGKRGLLLSGPACSGKSTLALALASLGCGFLCDDRILCWREGRELKAWTPLTDLKLRSESIGWFSDLHGRQSTGMEKPEAVRFIPESLPGITRLRDCEPCALVFLERNPSVQFEMTTISSKEAETRLAADLLSESVRLRERQATLIASVATIPCYRLRYQGDPWSVANFILSRFRHWQAARKCHGSAPVRISEQVPCPVGNRGDGQNSTPKSLRNSDSRVDAIRRFLRVSYREALPIMGKRISVETNNPDVLEHLRRVSLRYPSADTDCVSFHWRIVTQPDPSPAFAACRRLAFSDPGIRFAQFDHRNFFAVDLRRRRAVAFVTETMAADERAFTIPFLDSLFCMCSASLGFLPLFSSCVAIDGQGILILGGSGNGKTTASYILAKSGMELVADEGVFLERHGGALRAWGGFWPVAFRADALEYFPELESNSRPFAYHEFAYLHLDKSKLQGSTSRIITPVACVFLERLASARARVSRLPPGDLLCRIGDSLLFEEERSFRPQQLAMQARVARLPGYKIAYGVDPREAASAIKKLLVGHITPYQMNREVSRKPAPA
jgi:hypothetical protein